jgi:hypothetical protein
MECSQSGDTDIEKPGLDDLKKDLGPVDGTDPHGLQEVESEQQIGFKIEPTDHVEMDPCDTAGTEIHSCFKMEPYEEMYTDPSDQTDTMPHDNVKFAQTDQDNTETFHFGDMEKQHLKKELGLGDGTEADMENSNCDNIVTESSDTQIKTEPPDYIPEEMEMYVKMEPQESEFVDEGAELKTEPISDDDLSVKCEMGSDDASVSAAATVTSGTEEEQQQGNSDCDLNEDCGYSVALAPGKLPIHVVDPLHGGGMEQDSINLPVSFGTSGFIQGLCSTLGEWVAQCNAV